ncbi:MAG: LON peptidase substrate-binding domain-containing protein [Chloroflexi bacterium]|nr:LON peptidase substrate-binding domain-containing protein [Chloroflexota bacterium]
MKFPENDLPLFPLHTVLFPFQRLPLHIFEPRYREMMARCIEEEIGFGVLLIRDGLEVGAPAIPFQVGTLAQIEEVSHLPDGRLNIIVKGTRRFRVLELLGGRAYQTGRIELWDDEPADADEIQRAADEARRGFLDILNLLAAISKAQVDLPGEMRSLPDNPDHLAFVLAMRLQLGNADRQTLLEMTNCADRLRRVATYSGREIVRLKIFAEHPTRSAGQGKFSLN